VKFVERHSLTLRLGLNYRRCTNFGLICVYQPSVSSWSNPALFIVPNRRFIRHE